jgi:hypothetical protein
MIDVLSWLVRWTRRAGTEDFVLPWPDSDHTTKAIPFVYSFSGNCAASAPISTFMCL